MKTGERPPAAPPVHGKRVTEQLNAVYRRRCDSALDEVLETLQFLSLPDDEWETGVLPPRPARKPNRLR